MISWVKIRRALRPARKYKLVKMNMQTFAGRALGSFLRNAGWAKLGLVCLAGWMINAAQAAPTNDNFANAIVISGTTGTISGSNVGATLQPPCETNAIYVQDYATVETVGASVWYAWTAPTNGTASFNTIGSSLDTVLSIWKTTNGLCSSSLTNIVADDDSGGTIVGGSSALSFTAVAGTTYYVCVEGYFGAIGSVVLNWYEYNNGNGTVSSGSLFLTTNSYVFSTSDSSARVTVSRSLPANGRVLVDYAVSPLTYTNIYTTNYFGTNIFLQFTSTNGDWFITNYTFTTIVSSNIFGYYARGYTNSTVMSARTNVVTLTTNSLGFGSVTTRSATNDVPGTTPRLNLTTNTIYFQGGGSNTVNNPDGSSSVAVTNIFQLPSVVTNVVVIAGGGITTSSGTLAFDDFQMRQDILLSMSSASAVPGSGLSSLPSLASITLSNPRLDPQESSDLIPPTVGFNTVGLNTASALVNAISPTFTPGSQGVLSFVMSRTRVNENVNPHQVSLSVSRSGGKSADSPTVSYRIDFLPPADRDDQFDLQPGSDYATPNVDYTSVTGTLTWGANDTANKTITVPIFDDDLVEFNEDFRVELYNPTPAAAGDDPGYTLGQFSYESVTLISHTQPAGAVDRTWNKNNTTDSNPPGLMYPGTSGNGGTVYAVAEQPDGNLIIAGSFSSFDSHPYNRIVRALQNGYQDPSFLVAPNSGANDFIAALALQPDGKIIIGGNFTSFNGFSRFHIARLNSDGTLDTSFSPGLGANGMVWSVALDSAGRVLIAGDFSSVNNIKLNRVARLNADGSVDTSFNPGVGPNANVNAVVVDRFDRVLIGGDFDTVSGVVSGGVARLNTDGSLDTRFAPGIGTFNPNTQTTDPVYAIAVQPDGQILIGGGFSYLDLVSYNGIVRLNRDGTVDLSFSPGNGTLNSLTGITDTIYALRLQPDGEILIGGDFTTYNQTRRVGLARLYADGSLDTSFMDTAYNQFAGLINHYHNPDAVNNTLYPPGNDRNFVYALAQEWFTNAITTQFTVTNNNVITTNFVTTTNVTGGNVLIGGGFLASGGDYPPEEYINGALTSSDYRRDAVLPRSNVARLIGGFTPGPGNIALSYPSYTVAKDATYLYVSMVRNLTNNNITVINTSTNVIASNTNGITPFTNNSLGNVQVTVSVTSAAPGPGVAVPGVDYSLSPTYSAPVWVSAWDAISVPYQDYAWMYSQGVWGPNYGTIPVYEHSADVFININNAGMITGDLNANIKLSNPTANFALGGEVIPLGVALGVNVGAPMTITEVNYNAGVLGFSSPQFTVVENANPPYATITITRTNGTQNVVQVSYATTNGTAISGVDFTNVSGTLTFNNGDVSKSFNVPIIAGTTLQPDRTLGLELFNPSGGATLGLSNAVLTIVNNNFSGGHVSFASTNFSTNETSGTALVSLSRLGGSVGTMSVTLFTAGGSGVPGVDYSPYSNTITWNNKLAFATNIAIPVFHDPQVTSNRTVNLMLANLMLNSAPASTNAWGLITNATLTINNVDSVGTVQFSSPVYGVKKYAGYALIPVVRPGGTVGTVTVDYGTFNGTALAGTNYVATSGTLTFTNGQIGQTIRVPVIDTGASNGLTTVTLVLTNAQPAYALGSPSNAVLNIIDTESVNETPGSDDITYDALGMNNTVYAMALQTNNQLVVGGDFTMANGVPRQRIARLNSNGSVDAAFSLPSSAYGASDSVRTIAVQADGRILVGGFFTNFNSVNLSHIARLNSDGSLDSQFAPGSGTDNAVYALTETFVNGLSKVLVGGAFATVGGYPINNFARLNADGSIDTYFNTGLGPNDVVYAVAVQGDGKIVIGGDFTDVNGNTGFNHIARLNVDGSLDSTFNPGVGASDSVHAIAIQSDGRILIGGYFTSVNGTVLNHIARLNTDGSVDGTFEPGLGASDAVFSIALQSDGRIVLGGEFTECSGVTRNRVTRLNANGSVDPTINFGAGANNFVAAVVVQEDTIYGYPANVPDEKIIIGGGFTQYNGQPHAYLARIYGGSISGVGAFEFSAANYQVIEGFTNAIVTVLRTGGTSGTNADASGDILVPFTTGDNSAKAGINYLAVTNNLDFPEGEVLRSVTIPILDDGIISTNLTVNLAVNPSAPAAFGNQPTATLTIVNSDSAMHFSAPTYTVAKNAVNGAATINLVREGSIDGTSMVFFGTTTNGTATAGTDYYPTNAFVTFNPGVSSVLVSVPIINNNTATGNKTVGLQLTNAFGSFLYSPSNAMLTIIDTVHSPGQLSFSTTNYVITEGGGVGYTNAYITVLRSFGSLGAISAAFRTLDGTAVSGFKYIATNGVVAFGDGETIPKTFAVQVRNTTTAEGTEYLNLQLTNATGGAILVAPTNATLTILNTNTGISFVSAINTFAENGGSLFDGVPNTVLISVRRINSTNGAVTVNFATADGTAKANVNYQPASGTLTFLPGQSLATLPVSLINDTNVTGDLAFTINLSNPSPGALLVPPFQTTVVVQDADAGISFTNAAMSVLKNAGSAVITVVCSNPRVEPLTVDYATSDGTAVAGVNYLATGGTLVFANGVGTNIFTVPIINNTSVTGDKTFTVSLSNPMAPGQLVTPYVQTVTIVDANSGVQFSSPTYAVLKSQGTANISVLRTGYTNSVVSVGYIATNGTAIPGQDYTPASGTLVFSNGVTSQSFSVSLVNSASVRPDVTVLLQLFNPADAVLSPPNAATLTIHDNSGSYVIPAGSALVSEGGAGAPNGVIDSNETVTVLFAFRDAGGTNVADLQATLLATNGVTPTLASPANADYGPLAYLGHSVSRPFTFVALGTNGQQVVATFLLTNKAANAGIGTAVFGYTLGTWNASFTNTAPIIITDYARATPYPSGINVSGVSGSVVKTTLIWANVSHSSPADIDALLVAPNQLDTLFMAHAGGQNAINNVTLTFDDAATNSLPHFGQITNGVYKPTGYLPVPSFP
jgi:uncharacterized delta-60 repeat protein